jgi:hypothetical protein
VRVVVAVEEGFGVLVGGTEVAVAVGVLVKAGVGVRVGVRVGVGVLGDAVSPLS